MEVIPRRNQWAIEAMGCTGKAMKYLRKLTEDFGIWLLANHVCLFLMKYKYKYVTSHGLTISDQFDHSHIFTLYKKMCVNGICQIGEYWT